ncbi:uncharacterized protein LOC107869498 isoform X3 [Capsicum annuum]|uniref:uncharacterized protein LOC107869498 isoform X3 n=1 Tax=Capsicum annuum TaxID=4072 RepID=UPI001FB0E17B|nr:uncharacterized protein LOC107869498 isoform X3 [Capsicum annuum]
MYLANIFPKYLQNLRPKRSLLVHMNIHQQTSHVTMASEGTSQKKLPRFLCLHGFRTSGAILKKQIFDNWPARVVDKLDLVFVDAPFPCQGKSEVEGMFEPPYFEWYQFNKGAVISGGLRGLQDKGVGLTKVQKIKYLIIIGGAKFQNESVAVKAYSSPITCPSVHFLGEQDYLKKYGMELLDLYVDPVIIHHPQGHTIPRLGQPL